MPWLLSWLLYWLGACRLSVDPVESEELFAHAFDRFKAKSDRAGMLMAWAGAESSIQYSLIDISKLDQWIDIMLKIIRTGESFPSKEIETRVAFCYGERADVEASATRIRHTMDQSREGPS